MHTDVIEEILTTSSHPAISAPLYSVARTAPSSITVCAQCRASVAGALLHFALHLLFPTLQAVVRCAYVVHRRGCRL
jgi:hypothetical protein